MRKDFAAIVIFLNFFANINNERGRVHIGDNRWPTKRTVQHGLSLSNLVNWLRLHKIQQRMWIGYALSHENTTATSVPYETLRDTLGPP